MKHPLIAAAMLLLLGACRQETTRTTSQRSVARPAMAAQPAPTAAAVATDSGSAGPDFTALNALMQELSDMPTLYTVTGSKPRIIRGEKGIRVKVVPGDLETVDGRPVSGPIEVSLLEMTSQADFIRNGTPTMSDGRALVSGGAVDIRCTAGGRELRLKPGRTMEIAFPAGRNEPAMGTFYGERTAAGNFNWKPDERVASLSDAPVDSAWVERRIIHRADSVIAELHAKSSVKGGPSFVVRIDTVTDKVYLIAPKAGRPLDTVVQMVKVPKATVLTETVYDVLNVSRLGLINCDRFWEAEMTELLVGAPVNADGLSIVTLLVFKADNTVIQSAMHFRQATEAVPIMVAKGHACRMLAFAHSGKQLYGYSKELVTGDIKEVRPALRPITKAEMESMIGGKG